MMLCSDCDAKLLTEPHSLDCIRVRGLAAAAAEFHAAKVRIRAGVAAQCGMPADAIKQIARQAAQAKINAATHGSAPAAAEVATDTGRAVFTRQAAEALINAPAHGIAPALSTDSKARKATPIATGVLDYFPLALAAVARLSKIGNDKHNPGEPLNWSRGKSTDHADCILRHMADRGTVDPDSGELHEVGVAWRALAQLQLAEEKRLGL